MNHWMLRRVIQSDFESLLESLSTRQYLRPHEPLAEALAHTIECVGVCPTAVDQAVRWLHVEPSISIGRLRRTELIQLARSIHRFWRQATSQTAPQPQRQ